MAIRVALNHTTIYRYDHRVSLSPQTIRLRPAPHCRTPIVGYSLTVTPQAHFLNWQQDPQGNFLARVVFPEKTQEFRVEVDLVADLTVINPFDFFLEPAAKIYPFTYEPWLAKELAPFLETEAIGPQLQQWLQNTSRTLACYWRTDGLPLWHNDACIADETQDYGYGTAEAQRLVIALAERLGVDAVLFCRRMRTSGTFWRTSSSCRSTSIHCTPNSTSQKPARV